MILYYVDEFGYCHEITYGHPMYECMLKVRGMTSEQTN